ncbi:hypothetical protein [Blastopirellula marina]|uniref:Uncharacterized protein n=1 Tax=Blastopirellula marina TaxID=124 RepID=A0A2S8GE87_9BACT|nr:hypothetical protein [Blastopirellula marina]PQO42404.1 hypothetical protein C5Y93_29175 [Blastopirellula marina]
MVYRHIVAGFVGLFACLIGADVCPAALITYAPASIQSETPFTFTGDSQSQIHTLTLPTLAPEVGTIDVISIYQKHVLTTDARSTATGGIDLGGGYIGNWVWNVQSSYSIQGAGVSVSNTETLRRFGNFTDPTIQHSAQVLIDQVLVETTQSFAAPSGFTGGGVTQISIDYGHTTAFPPLPATPAGFTWDIFETVTGAGIQQRMTSTYVVQYEFTPTSVTVVPEPSGAVSMAACLMMSVLSVGAFRNTRFGFGLTQTAEENV